MNNKDEELFKRYKLALEHLTVGGSEYYNEPETCAYVIKKKLDDQSEMIKKLIKERKEKYKEIEDRENELLKRYKMALEHLTAMGSEYYNNPERCARDIQDRISFQGERIEELSEELREIYLIPVIGWFIDKIIKRKRRKRNE
jgi:hypothetical protein